jgi:hypothetical protein
MQKKSFAIGLGISLPVQTAGSTQNSMPEQLQRPQSEEETTDSFRELIMENSIKQRSVSTSLFMLLIAFSVLGAVMMQSPATAATDIHCRLPKDAAVDRIIAQSGKARPAATTPEIAQPVSITRKQANHAGVNVPATPVSYVRCAKNPG